MGLFGGKKKQTRKGRAEPRLFESEAPPARGRGKTLPPKKRRSFLGWLFRLFFALGLWSAIAVGCLVAFTWFSLNQKGLFQIPQREPGVMILASDGSEIAEQGTFFGDAVALWRAK